VKHYSRPSEVENVQQGKAYSTRSLRRQAVLRGESRRKKTGQPSWFRKMLWDIKRKAMLKELPVSLLLDKEICTQRQVEALSSSGYGTVWDVVDAKYKDLLKVGSFGPKTVAKLWEDLRTKAQLEPNWNPDGR